MHQYRQLYGRDDCDIDTDETSDDVKLNIDTGDLNATDETAQGNQEDENVASCDGTDEEIGHLDEAVCEQESNDICFEQNIQEETATGKTCKKTVNM